MSAGASEAQPDDFDPNHPVQVGGNLVQRQSGDHTLAAPEVMHGKQHATSTLSNCSESS
jgi:hypothetical protein